MTNASFADLAVLVVDDNKDMRGLLEGIVREFGVRSIETARGAELVGLLRIANENRQT